MEKTLNSVKCLIMSWEEAYRFAKIIAHKIKISGFRPDLVVGVSRGGLVPARTVCDFLLQKDLASIRVEHWGIAKTLGRARIKYTLPAGVSGKKVLVVDDVADTGDSFVQIMKYLNDLNPAEVRTAVLQYKTCSTFVPDYWGQKQEEWKWIIYPWAIYEDMTGFISEVLVSSMTLPDIREDLKSNFDIKISRKELLEILNEMYLSGLVKKGKKGKKIIWEIKKDRK
jgi:hypoxanthine phosphoribosyltransferase